ATLENASEARVPACIDCDTVAKIIARTAKALAPERCAGGGILCRHDVPRASGGERAKAEVRRSLERADDDGVAARIRRDTKSFIGIGAAQATRPHMRA